MSRFPLYESIVLCFLLLTLAWPLAALTGNHKLESNSVSALDAGEEQNKQHTSFLIKVYGSEKLNRIRISIENQQVVEAIDINSNDWECERKLPLVDGILPIVLEASFISEEQDEALKIEFWPEALVEQSFTFWGTGEIVEELEVKWERYE